VRFLLPPVILLNPSLGFQKICNFCDLIFCSPSSLLKYYNAYRTCQVKPLSQLLLMMSSVYLSAGGIQPVRILPERFHNLSLKPCFVYFLQIMHITFFLKLLFPYSPSQNSLLYHFSLNHLYPMDFSKSITELFLYAIIRKTFLPDCS
jgi:hypothetical protein